MIGNLVVKIEPAKPAIRQMKFDLLRSTAARSGGRSNNRRSASGSSTRDQSKAGRSRCRRLPACSRISASIRRHDRIDPPQADGPPGCVIEAETDRTTGSDRRSVDPSWQTSAAESLQTDGITVRRKSQALFRHGVIPGSSQTKAQGISSLETYEAILMWPCNDGERQWNTMSDWTCR